MDNISKDDFKSTSSDVRKKVRLEKFDTSKEVKKEEVKKTSATTTASSVNSTSSSSSSASASLSKPVTTKLSTNFDLFKGPSIKKSVKRNISGEKKEDETAQTPSPLESLGKLPDIPKKTPPLPNIPPPESNHPSPSINEIDLESSLNTNQLEISADSEKTGTTLESDDLGKPRKKKKSVHFPPDEEMCKIKIFQPFWLDDEEVSFKLESFFSKKIITLKETGKKVRVKR